MVLHFPTKLTEEEEALQVCVTQNRHIITFHLPAFFLLHITIPFRCGNEVLDVQFDAKSNMGRPQEGQRLKKFGNLLLE